VLRRRRPSDADAVDLAGLSGEQERAVAYVRSAVAATETPASLRARIDEQRRMRRPVSTRRLALAAAGATIVVTAVAGLAVVRSNSSGPADEFRAALAPTGAVAGARGRATLSETPSGWRVTLHAAGLPHLEGGRFYEAWLRNRAGTLVPIGTFNDGRHVTLWAGVDPRRSWTLTVTRERTDGNQASSGDVVLVGPVDLPAR
jgi:hypothetical protein